MYRFSLIVFILSLITVPSVSFGSSDSEIDMLYELFNRAKGLEETNIDEAKRIYKKIEEEYPNTVDDVRSEVTFAFAFEAMQRLKVLACRGKAITREQYTDFDEFYAFFVRSVNSKDKESFEKLMGCDFVVGKAETCDVAIENPAAFSEVIIRYLEPLPYKVPTVRGSLYSIEASADKYSTFLVISNDDRGAALYIGRSPKDKYLFRHEFILKKNGYWQIQEYHTSDGDYLNNLREDIWKKDLSLQELN